MEQRKPPSLAPARPPPSKIFLTPTELPSENNVSNVSSRTVHEESGGSGSESNIAQNSPKQDKKLEDAENRGVNPKSATHTLEDIDHFVPFPPLQDGPAERSPLTVRAVLLGCFFGGLICAADLYTGLKTGVSVGGADFIGTIIGFAIIRSLVKVLPMVPGVGSPFGPQENVILQAAARGANGASSIFAATIPAMYKLGVLTDPRGDYIRIALLVSGCTLVGLFVAAPLRRFFIVDAARRLNLRFPGEEALAHTIRSMHEAGSGAKAAMDRFRTLCIVFVASFAWKIGSSYAPGILYDWHIFTWFYIWSGYTNWAINIENWGWIVELTPGFTGIGMLVGLRVAASLFAGSVLNWAIIGPILVHAGVCVGEPAVPGAGPRWKDYMTFTRIPGTFNSAGALSPSPYYWMMWPAVIVLVAAGLVELLLNSPALFDGCRQSVRGLQVRRRRTSRDSSENSEERGASLADRSTSPTALSGWTIGIGLLLSVALTLLIVQFAWKVNSGLVAVGLLLTGVCSFINIYGQGTTALSTTVATATLIMLTAMGLIWATHMPVASGLMFAQVTMGIMQGISTFSASLMGDFRVGFLLRTPSNLQFWAQAAGTVCAGFVGPAVFLLFASAWPCILWSSDEQENRGGKCAFQVPSATMEAEVMPAAVTGDVSFGIIPSSMYFSAALGAAVVVHTVLLRVFSKKPWIEVVRRWSPNWFGLGLGMVISTPQLCIAIFIGALLAHFWQQRRPSAWGIYGYSTAAGLVAGESLGGLATAVLEIAGVGSRTYGSAIGCPADLC